MPPRFSRCVLLTHMVSLTDAFHNISPSQLFYKGSADEGDSLQMYQGALRFGHGVEQKPGGARLQLSKGFPFRRLESNQHADASSNVNPKANNLLTT